MTTITSPSYTITMRLEIQNQPGMFAKVANAIGKKKGNLGAIDIVQVQKDTLIRDVTVYARDEDHSQAIIDSVKKIKGIKLISVSDRVFLMHLGGKISIKTKVPLTTRNSLSMAYTPGVARVCMAIAEDKKKAHVLTIKKNSVAIVTDGTAVLGLGDIGPEAAMPVMEGKAMLFKEFGDVDAYPICLDTKDTEEIIKTVKYISPGFGGINLEDISAPRCFTIEERLKKELNIPVFHDDQHGTAVVVLAALINALKIVNKKMKDIKIVISGVGAAGVACTKVLLSIGVKEIIGVDTTGIIYKGRTEGMNFMKDWFAEHTNTKKVKGSLKDALHKADVFIGVSAPGLLKGKDLTVMKKDPIIFAMANPIPEIMPEEAAPYARIIATGRSDYPNQVNNVLCFPGMFRGALDVRARDINEEMKIAAAYAIANTIKDSELSEEYIIPSVFNKKVFQSVASAVAKAAISSGIAHRTRISLDFYEY
jgi:malate dehydrogenase (oxaloacetate-decarboxylating)